MSILPVSIARVSDLQRSAAADQALQTTQQQLQTVENQLSTGLAITQPSDNPAAAAVILQLQQTLQQQQGYTTNLNQSTSQLGEVDNQLGSLENLLNQAQTVASENVGTDATPQARQAASAVVNSLYTQALSIANTQFEGSYIFGGDNATQAPFAQTAAGLNYVGSSTTLENTFDQNTQMSFQVNGAAVFGALSAQVQGTNLSPAPTAQTRLSDLQGAIGNGVAPGAIQIGNGTTTQVVNLSTASSLGDVVNAINNAGVAGVTASISGSGLLLTAAGGANISVSNIAGDTTATDLGITTAAAGAGAGVNVVGQNLNAAVTPLTDLASLNGGAGLDPSGIVISNGAQTATLNFSSDTTVQDLLNTINGANLGVRAQINSTGTGINIINTLQGTTLSIGENGGNTATQLGVRTFSPSTLLSSLNGGQGLQLATTGADMQINRANGTTFQVSLAGATTVQDVINDINTANGGGGVTASFAATGNGIVLTDTTGGTGTLSVTALNNSGAVQGLGLNATATGNTLTGSDPNGVTSTGILADLASLSNALSTNDTTGINAAAQNLQTDYNNVTTQRGSNGAVLQDMQNLQTAVSQQTTSTQTLLSQLQDTDYTTAITQFQTLQTSLQAGLETAAQTLPLTLLDFLE